ncbi:DNA-deoxyinosine glycosylase [Noviherbaspirillum sp. UKPF54]|uniref:DNA-deoxyinosine glycosylase n=1 Tax=Noviherbaspirillum sp. UKPF54 TaxID=2601898 RepID=UPI0011B11450|nr:DNA-deoxyinosine glycosylase [Noviherbaspirillum sp. UKPF54]QDZ30582.1 DNA-deoxyinosine glycosylase [Noviherbaspirillum sp. UKPF54]
MTRKRSFDPVVDENTRLLILGSLPGEVSLMQSQYYANPKNRFWQLVSPLVGTDLSALPYPDRLPILLANGIGLWDVVAEAHREGSLDSKIRDHAHNDLVGLIAGLPRLAAIAFNGGTAARLGLKALADRANRYRIVRLPSSSPAYTLAYADKLRAWEDLKQYLRTDAAHPQ